MAKVFNGSFTQQEPISEEAISAAVDVLRSGRLHRYNLAPEETGQVSDLEAEFASMTGARYALAVASGGYAMGCALRALGVVPGDPVLSNAFTLAPVPGAIASVGARPILVETTEDLTIDFDHLQQMAAESGARTLMLSHMRGHICDMDRLLQICDHINIQVIEDCAHTMGAAWRNVPSGRHGVIGCYSTQTYKHINSGEGGLIVCDDDDLMARMVVLSGSYMNFGKHVASPPPDMFENTKLDMPNVSGRMDHLRAAILRPQLRDLSAQVARWNTRYAALEDGLRNVRGLRLIHRPDEESIVGSSFQFRLPDFTGTQIGDVITKCGARGVELKWFGAEEPVAFTSKYTSWRYVARQSLPQTDRILAGLLDMRVPLTFSIEDCTLIAEIIKEEVMAAG